MMITKRRILDSFSHALTDGVVVSVQAYTLAFRAKFMLLALCQALEYDLIRLLYGAITYQTSLA